MDSDRERTHQQIFENFEENSRNFQDFFVSIKVTSTLWQVISNHTIIFHLKSHILLAITCENVSNIILIYYWYLLLFYI